MPTRHDREVSKASGLAASVWVILLIVLLVRAYLQPHRNSVYPIFANAAREWHQGIDVYDDSVQRGALDKFRYAPIVAMAFIPLATLPDFIGGVLWRSLNAACFLAGVVAFFRVVAPGKPLLQTGGWALLAWLLLPLSVGSLNNAQPNSLIAGCLLLGAAACLRQRLNLAAACFAVPVLIKVYPFSVVALFVLVQPRLGWRVLVLVAAGLAAPFAFQKLPYVMGAYQSWLAQIGGDDRHAWPLENSYRDMHALLRCAGWTVGGSVYLGLQLAAAALLAGMVWRGHRLGWDRALHLRAALDLGCSWMILFGPATENSTYALLAPTMALAVWEALQAESSAWKRGWAVVTLCIFIVGTAAAVTPFGKSVSYFMMPLGGMLVFAERVLFYCQPVAARRRACYVDSDPLPAW